MAAAFVNGVQVPGLIEAEVCSNAYLAADRFALRFALQATGTAMWQAAALQAEVRFGLGESWASLILGSVDQIAFDVLHGEVRIEGRDLSSRFMGVRTQENFENRSAGEIVAMLAARRGLVANVGSTPGLVGRYYRSDYARTTLDQFARATTEWDLLAWLAENEGFDVWVEGNTLNFLPPRTTGSLMLSPQQCLDLRLERTVSLGGDVGVVVKSWCSKEQQAILASAGMADASQPYVMVRPNLTQADAQQLADRLYSEMSGHEMAVSIEMPGDLTTTPRMGLALRGAGSGLDGDYVVCEVERRVSVRHGFLQSLRAKAA